MTSHCPVIGQMISWMIVVKWRPDHKDRTWVGSDHDHVVSPPLLTRSQDITRLHQLCWLQWTYLNNFSQSQGLLLYVFLVLNSVLCLGISYCSYASQYVAEMCRRIKIARILYSFSSFTKLLLDITRTSSKFYP